MDSLVTGLLPTCRGAEEQAEAGLQCPSTAMADWLPCARQVLVQQPALAYWANVASRKSLLHAAAGALAPRAAALLPHHHLPCWASSAASQELAPSTTQRRFTLSALLCPDCCKRRSGGPPRPGQAAHLGRALPRGGALPLGGGGPRSCARAAGPRHHARPDGADGRVPARVRAALQRPLCAGAAAPLPGRSGASRSASAASLPAPAATRTRLPSPSLGDCC